MVIYQAKSEPTNYKPMGGIWPADVFDINALNKKIAYKIQASSSSVEGDV